MNEASFWKAEYPSDLFVENFYRFIAKKVAGLLSFLPVSANFFTFLRVPLGTLIILLFLFSESYLLLFVLMVFWKIVDKVDGAWARQKNQVSKFGAWLDIVVDRFFWGFVLFGITVAVYKDVPTHLPWILLFFILLGHTLFQNFTFLGEGMKLVKISSLNWNSQVSSFRKRAFLYQIVFTIYYLWDQVVALALLLQVPIKVAFSVSSLMLTLVVFAVFFNGAVLYVLISHWKTMSLR
jgi:phosphatidylglycerophosphate synthase